MVCDTECEGVGVDSSVYLDWRFLAVRFLVAELDFPDTDFIIAGMGIFRLDADVDFIIDLVGTRGRLADVATIIAGITPGTRGPDVAFIIAGIRSFGRFADVASINAGITPGTRELPVCSIICSMRLADPFERSSFESLSARALSCSGGIPMYTVVGPAPAPPVTVIFPWVYASVEVDVGLRTSVEVDVGLRTSVEVDVGLRTSVEVDVGPVSYTHLTLPTIYSV